MVSTSCHSPHFSLNLFCRCATNLSKHPYYLFHFQNCVFTTYRLSYPTTPKGKCSKKCLLYWFKILTNQSTAIVAINNYCNKNHRQNSSHNGSGKLVSLFLESISRQTFNQYYRSMSLNITRHSIKLIWPCFCERLEGVYSLFCSYLIFSGAGPI